MIQNSEILNRFDVLYNNITSSQAPGLDNYEKSVFWNKATLEVLKNHINPKGNKYGEGFDNSSKRQIEFSSLTDEALLRPNGTCEFCINATRFPAPTDVLSVLNEYAVFNAKVYDSDGNEHLVRTTLVGVPINHVEYDTLMSRPYKFPPRSQAWRMYIGNNFEVISAIGDNLEEYHVRYVRKPKEVNLGDNNDVPEIPEVLVDEVLQRAVELAKAAYVGDVNQQQIVQSLGERSE